MLDVFSLLLCWTLFVHKKRDREREVTLYCIYNLEYLIWSFEMLHNSNRLVHVVIHLLFTIHFCLKTKCLSVPRQKASPSWKHITLPLIPSLPITRQFAYPPPPPHTHTPPPAPGKGKRSKQKSQNTEGQSAPVQLRFKPRTVLFFTVQSVIDLTSPDHESHSCGQM